MEPFLKPLSAQEEKSCLDAYQRGDTKARDILVERNLRLVAHVVKKYQGLPDDLDDLISIGTIGLIKAVMTYDSKKGNRLAAYAARCIDNELLMYLRSKKKTAREISLYEPIGTDKAYQRGDTKARDILVERNLRLVAHVVKKYQGLPDDLDDLISIGTIGLIKAVMTYDSKKGNRLAAYAARCIDNELLMYLRSKKKTAREISLYEPIGTDKEGNEIHLLDIVEGGGEDIAEQYNRKEDAVRLYCYLDSELKEQEKQVLLLRYGLGGNAEYTQKQVAARLGISRSYVSRIEKNAIEKLRLRFAAS